MSEPQTVNSLAGEEVLIFDDDDYAQLCGFEPRSRQFALSMQMSDKRVATLRALWRHGSIVDRSGMATTELANRIRNINSNLGVFSLNAVMTQPPMLPCIERVTRGKRTFSIALVALPQKWLADVERPVHDASFRGVAQLSIEDVADAVRRGAPVVVPQPPQPLEEPAAPELHYEVADAVATALLARVVELIAGNGSGNVMAAKASQLTTEVQALTRRLGEQTAYVDRLRRDVRAAQDEVAALKVDNAGLRQRAQAAEHNLKVATGKDAQRIIDEEVHRQVDRIMRQAPGSDKQAV